MSSSFAIDCIIADFDPLHESEWHNGMVEWNTGMGFLMTYVCHMVRNLLFLKEHMSLPHNISKSTALRNVVVRQ